MLIRYNECVIRRQIQRPPSYSSHSHSRAANENLPQFVALCKKVHCTLINQNSGPTTTTKRITILRFFITNIKHTQTHTHIFMASSDASLQTNELYGWCFSYVLHCDAINYSNEPPPRMSAFWVAQKYSTATTTSQPESWCHSATNAAAGEGRAASAIKTNFIFDMQIRRT